MADEPLDLEPIKRRLAVPRAHLPRQDAIDLIAEVERLRVQADGAYTVPSAPDEEG